MNKQELLENISEIVHELEKLKKGEQGYIEEFGYAAGTEFYETNMRYALEANKDKIADLLYDFMNYKGDKE